MNSLLFNLTRCHWWF